MVNVIVMTGITAPALTDIDLTPYSKGPIARLIGVRTLTGSHRHVLSVEVSNPAVVAGSGALGTTASGLLFSETPLATTMPTAIQLASVALSSKTINNSGLLSQGATGAANSAVLSGRLAINLGDAIASVDVLHVTVLLQQEAAGIF